MRTAVLSDIHGNLQALQAVLAFCDASGVDDYICLGDVVGYGAGPNACVERVRTLTDCTVAGNHDYAAVGLADLNTFNPLARAAAVWTAGQLTGQNAEYLRERPMVLETADAVFVHAAPYEPEAWHYVFDADDTEVCFAQTDRTFCFLGHSHVAFICVARGQGREMAASSLISDGCRYVINVGSVGQPRDFDPRAAFALWDRSRGEIGIVRVDYDIAGAQRRIVAAGLPPSLAERLAVGR
ncbi:MAG: metallophosphoesterase [Candidatus Latescibacteria bacterium]|nr:metallophosphoesterase [Candidatus Latescibacterota bacterium]